MGPDTERRTSAWLAAAWLVAASSTSTACSGGDVPLGHKPDAATSCAPPGYPADPPGSAVGDVLDACLAWPGVRADGEPKQTLRVLDFYDPERTGAANALVVLEAAWGDAAAVVTSQIESALAGALPDAGPTPVDLSGTGTRVLTLLTTGPGGAPDASVWAAFTHASWPIGEDPARTFAHETPYLLLVDPCAMRIAALTMLSGDPTPAATLNQLLAQARDLALRTGCAP